MVLLAPVLLLPLTACPNPIVTNDPHDECDHPAKPAKPYTDESAALYITAQGEVIDICRALLGNKPRIE